MDLSLSESLFVFALIGFSGFIDAIAGGGGLISVPTYLSVGIPPQFLLGTNKCVSTIGGTIAAFRYAYKKLVYWKVTGFGVFFGLIGSYLGASLSGIHTKQSMTLLLVIVVPVILILNTLRERNLKKRGKRSFSEKQLQIRSSLSGLIIGFYDGIYGPGTGSFLIMAYLFFLHFSYKESATNARMINYASNVAALVFFLIQGKILWNVALIGLSGSAIGNFLGSQMTISKGDQWVKPVFYFVLGLLVIRSISML